MRAQGRPWGGQLLARGAQNDATSRQQASKMEQKWIRNQLELELRRRRVGEFPFRLFSLARGCPVRGLKSCSFLGLFFSGFSEAF